MAIIQTKSSFRREVRAFLEIAVPLAGAQVTQSATGFADTIMMGRMGTEVLAAGGLAAIVFLCIMITVSGMVMGVSPLVAEAFGAGQSARIRQLTHQGLWLALLISIPAMFATGHLDVWMRHTGQTATTLALADTYLNIILWSLFPITGFAALRSTVAAMSQARPILLIIVVGTLFNIVGNYVLGFGKLGLPAMGLAGLAIATVVAWWAMFIALLLYVLWHPAFRRYRFFRSVRSVGSRGVSVRTINLRIFWQLLSIGVPIGVFSGLEMGFFMVVTFLAGTLGTEVLAAHQIVFQTIVVVFMVPLGVSYAATVRVGQWLGRRDLVSLRRAAQIGMVLSTICMVSASAAFLLFPKQIVGFYLDVQAPENAAIVALALPLLVVAAIAQILDGFARVARHPGSDGVEYLRLLGCGAICGICAGLSLGYGQCGTMGRAIGRDRSGCRIFYLAMAMAI